MKIIAGICRLDWQLQPSHEDVSLRVLDECASIYWVKLRNLSIRYELRIKSVDNRKYCYVLNNEYFSPERLKNRRY